MPAPASGSTKNSLRVVTTEHDERGREIFTQRREAALGAVAALMQRTSGAVERDREQGFSAAFVLTAAHVDQQIGMLRIEYERHAALDGAVDQRVLHGADDLTFTGFDGIGVKGADREARALVTPRAIVVGDRARDGFVERFEARRVGLVEIPEAASARAMVRHGQRTEPRVERHGDTADAHFLGFAGQERRRLFFAEGAAGEARELACHEFVRPGKTEETESVDSRGSGIHR